MKRSSILFAVSAAVLASSPARAEGGGLPQFDVSLFPEQLFWLALTFSSLFLLMKYLALPGVEKAQDNRKQVIGAEIAAAKAANEQAKAAGHQADEALAKARAKAQATISAIKTDGSKAAADEQSAQAKRLGQRLRDAESNIAATRDAALKDIETAVADLAAVIVETVAGSKVKA